MLESGDIIAQKAEWWQKPLTKLVLPYTDRVHFFLLGTYIPEENDWTIYESLVSRGVRVGRLSLYKSDDLKIYRVDKDIGKLAAQEVSKYGRQRWDYLLFLRIILYITVKYIKHGFKKVPYNEVPNFCNKALMCTELVTKAYDKYIRLVPEGICVTPSALEQAYLDDKMHFVFKGILPEDFNEANHGI